MPFAAANIAMPSPARATHRKLSDYCGIFAEKTNRIGRNVESFMQSRGLLPIRRSVDETTPPRRDPVGINGDTIGNDLLPRVNRATLEDHRRDYENRSYELPCGSNAPKKRMAYSNNTVYLRDPQLNVNYVHRSNETEPRRSRRREYTEADYGAVDVWMRDSGLTARGPSISRPILRNGINHGGDERLYYSTLPRRSRTINFRDQACGSSEGRRPYPKSLLDLTDLELDDVASLLSPRGRIGYGEETFDDYRQRGSRNRREADEPFFEDDYLKLCRNLSSLDRYPRGDVRYEPGQVHYERECRTFGKDTVAFIYYKTCYL